MQIVSWNTNGLRATVKQNLFFPLFENGEVDILCLQETKAERSQLPSDVQNVLGYFSYFSHSEIKKGYSGVAIYSRVKPDGVFYGMGIKKFDVEGRFIGVFYKKNNLIILNVYFPNGGQGPERLKYKLEFYDAFLKFILRLRKEGKKVIFCGDVNTAHNEIDLARPKANEQNTGFLPVERAWITKVIENKFIDVWRYFHKDIKNTYTYWDQKTRARDRNVGWRIDYFFADIKLLPKIKDAGMNSDYMGSDHCPIWMEVF